MSSNQDNLIHRATGITKMQFHEMIYTWIIEDFIFHERKGDELNSPSFSAKTNGEYKWYLSLHPSGYDDYDGTDADADNDSDDDYKKKMGLYLNLQNVNSTTRVFVNFRAHILDDQSKVLHSSPIEENDDVEEFTIDNSAWGWGDFLTKEDDFRSKYLSNNKLTIRCELKFSEMSENNPSNFEVPVCDLYESMATLYENHDFSDVIISVNGKNYPAHKNILCTRSPVFAAMFKHNTKENQLNRVEIEDMKEEEVEDMLRYIYTGKCEKLETLAEGLLAAADKYGLDRLKIMCAEALFKTVTVENAANMAIFAEMHSVDLLKSNTIDFISRRFHEVMNTEGWKNVLANHQLVNEIFLAFKSASSNCYK